MEKLEQKKRSLQSQIKSEQEKREQQLQQLTVERRMLEEDCGRLREQIEKAAADMRAYARMHPQVRDGQRPGRCPKCGKCGDCVRQGKES